MAAETPQRCIRPELAELTIIDTFSSTIFPFFNVSFLSSLSISCKLRRLFNNLVVFLCNSNDFEITLIIFASLMYSSGLTLDFRPQYANTLPTNSLGKVAGIGRNSTRS